MTETRPSNRQADRGRRHSRTSDASTAASTGARFIGWTAAGGVAAAAAALGIAESSGGARRPRAAPPHAPPGPAPSPQHRGHGDRPDPAPQSSPSWSTGSSCPISPAIVAENAKTGDAWWVTTPQNAGDIEGYASQVSAVAGDTVTLFVSTKAAQFHVEAYRMGYYQGIGGRLVWQSAEVPGVRQAASRAHRTHQHHRVPVDPVADRHRRQRPGRRAPIC